MTHLKTLHWTLVCHKQQDLYTGLLQLCIILEVQQICFEIERQDCTLWSPIMYSLYLLSVQWVEGQLCGRDNSWFNFSWHRILKGTVTLFGRAHQCSVRDLPMEQNVSGLCQQEQPDINLFEGVKPEQHFGIFSMGRSQSAYLTNSSLTLHVLPNCC